MKQGLRIGDFELFWLRGGRFALDGGGMFGVVPRVLWEKKYPPEPEDRNYVPVSASPILVRTGDTFALIGSGIGNKLDEKQRKIFRVKEGWHILEDLRDLGIAREDIRFVILTHFDWDHASGVTMRESGDRIVLTFPRARHIVQREEWEDALNPNRRSVNTYWPVNYAALRESGNLGLADGEKEIIPGLRVVRTGGHTRGHQIVLIESRGQKALHLGDLLPVHVQFNPLWITAFDNYPMDSISQKEIWLAQGVKDGAWFTFYHDPLLRACKFDEKGDVVERWSGGGS